MVEMQPLATSILEASANSAKSQLLNKPNFIEL
jgi:hypothetical protein